MSRHMLQGIRKIRPAWWVLALIVATAGVWQRYQYIETAQAIEARQRRIVELSRIRDQLLAENARLASRERIERIAVQGLGMVPTRRSQKRTLQVDTAAVAFVADQ